MLGVISGCLELRQSPLPFQSERLNMTDVQQGRVVQGPRRWTRRNVEYVGRYGTDGEWWERDVHGSQVS
jgi:hypothetical protein